MKRKAKNILIIIGIPVFIIVGCLGLDKLITAHGQSISQKPEVVWNDSSALSLTDDKPLEIVSKKTYGNVQGFSENFGFINSNEAIVGIGMDRDKFYKKYTKALSKMTDKESNEAMDDFQGSVYKLNLTTFEKYPLNIETKNVTEAVVSNINKLRYAKDNKYNLYDINANKNIEYDNFKEDWKTSWSSNWSEDGNYLIRQQNSNINLYDIKNNKNKEIKIDKKYVNMGSLQNFYSRDGKDIYFIGEQYKDNDLNNRRQGIFKVNSETEKIDEVLLFPYVNISAGNSIELPLIGTIRKGNLIMNGLSFDIYGILDNGKKIIFDGILNNSEGLYVYDVDTRKFYNLINHVNSKESKYALPFWISPDKSKIIYKNIVIKNNKDQWNLYAAKINGNNLTDRKLLAENINTLGNIYNEVQWSPDSKSILYFTGKNQTTKNEFTFMDKNEVNIVTFK
ncbi:hypothetical protein CPAST_c13980 [Clostridium pasteurianum DSM 525 = ATCC 6013]|uniref:Uncharacterized protein n=1 Tax=Clostridium pasteurianum DSM 525 = ATCC 6013 TaxID=1262449 RepID=A0A0H3J3Q6_CLOPA|nr:hypothetical protein [Clostridium pasteurianum]AJA47477.1 hypothetical protein CPAST_c13980 [Clostridium pasteurianum DSM 525 = ATCC 6013]AJA51465.1 hypothetical protein CLPA_c13980 [Clostridium pasteurianum DSM 525 = ATCC 6013]AOZ74798.1 hypothetical protein AQ983_06750 [Clostridium pasteurianum DSM 525 = ATCC 6013]AOZ78594.1 hypothetical protein AQ984_06740 [Clostridium pasteurianum]ELP57686.1 hypothetical protein F502_18711 [Clostridium pasteurianum DSM 525 = ATCC 6013]